MESVTAHAIVLVEFIGNGIEVSLLGHGLVESGVEHTHLGESGHQLGHSLHAFQVGGVVQRSQVAAFFKYLEHLVGKHNTLVELLATMHHTVTHGIDFLEVFNHADFGVGKQGEDKLHAFGVFGDVVHHLLFFTIGQLHLDESSIEAHAFCAT